ncbi:MAG: TlpA family protein disulfide reductase [Anaerolineales bacterium]|nr:TlpA family protein disulfide reductase [Anaerolineales bacterium]MDW8162387.1 TlpA disulfide reductase family protein [Anaerolineales bacterium]
MSATSKNPLATTLLRKRFFALLTLACALGWTLWSRVPSAALSAPASIAPQKGFLAPDFTLESTTGESFTLSALRGKPVILNFWASWCPPCRAEMPALQAVHEQYGAELVLLGINASTQDRLPNAYRLIAEMRLTFPILLDISGTTITAYRVFSLPTTFFIDRQGIIREVVVGGPLSEASLRVRLERLIAKEE